MRILGINDQHNASACVVEDGVTIAAIQEERLSRIKNHFCFPHGAIRWVLEATDTRPDELDVVAIASHHIIGPFGAEDLVGWYSVLNSPKERFRRAAKRTPLRRIAKQRRRARRLSEVERAGLPVDRTVFVDHHTAHAAAAYHGSPWNEEPVLVLTADGAGDGLSATVRIGSDGRMAAPLATIGASDSLGAIWATITALMGMVPLEHEYKLMGLAPYASRSGAEGSYRAFSDTLAFTEDGLAWRRARGMPDMELAYPMWRDRLERHRFDSIAAGLQRFTEEHLVDWVRGVVRATGITRLALGGGVFMNVKANQRIYEMPDIDDLFIFPSCGDETNSIGAAFHALEERAGGATPGLGPLYWGPDITDRDVEPLLVGVHGDGYRAEYFGDGVDDVVADLLAAGEVVARARGRMEFGARALGNRSILADPSDRGVVQTINEMIKSRDFWMPFAPAILAEEADEYLVNPRGLPAPYMIITFDSTHRVGEILAAVHPYDRTVRPQVVEQEDNPAFHRLIARFRELTGRGAILNTSFNLHGHPIVCTAADAVDVFRRSGLRHLAVAGYLMTKPEVPRGITSLSARAGLIHAPEDARRG